MRSAEAAFVWEFWRRGWWHCVNVVLVAVGFPALIGGAFRAQGLVVEPGTWTTPMNHLILVLVSAFIMMAGAALPPTALYAFPLPTWKLVAGRMLPGMVATALVYPAIVWLHRVLFGIEWPLSGAMLYCVTVLVCMEAAIWPRVRTPWRLVAACTVVGLALFVWLETRYLPAGYFLRMPTAEADHLWTTLTLGEVATLLACMALAYVAAVASVARDRRGDTLDGFDPDQLFAWLFQWLPMRSGEFRSPAAAQFWFEWVQKGWIMPCVWAVILAGVILVCLIQGERADQLFEIVLGFGMLLPLVCLVIGIVLGYCHSTPGRVEMGSFAATRPLTDAALSASMLKTGALSLLAVWLMWLLAALGAGEWMRQVQGMNVAALIAPRCEREFNTLAPVLGNGLPALLLLGLLALGWTVLAMTAVLTMTGRPWFWLLTYFGGGGLAIAHIFAYQLLIPDGYREQLQRGEAWFFGLLILLASVWWYAAALRRRHIGPRTVWLAAGGWLAMCAGGAAVWLSTAAANPPLMVLAAAALALPFAPLATAPLALAWNRHR